MTPAQRAEYNGSMARMNEAIKEQENIKQQKKIDQDKAMKLDTNGIIKQLDAYAKREKERRERRNPTASKKKTSFTQEDVEKAFADLKAEANKKINEAAGELRDHLIGEQSKSQDFINELVNEEKKAKKQKVNRAKTYTIEGVETGHVNPLCRH